MPSSAEVTSLRRRRRAAACPDTSPRACEKPRLTAQLNRPSTEAGRPIHSPHVFLQASCAHACKTRGAGLLRRRPSASMAISSPRPEVAARPAQAACLPGPCVVASAGSRPALRHLATLAGSTRSTHRAPSPQGARRSSSHTTHRRGGGVARSWAWPASTSGRSCPRCTILKE